jgi:hypothetical protein
MIKNWIKFNEELKLKTYADIMNKSEKYPWVRNLGDKLSKSDKLESINTLAKELFTREFLKEFKPGLTINNGAQEWSFEGIKFNANYTNYSLIFESGNERLIINYYPSGYHLPQGVEDNLDDKSKKLIIDMFKYMRL